MSSKSFLKIFNNLFPIPKDLSLDFVGIDMCETSIKAVKLKDSKYGRIPSAFKEYKLNERCGILDIDPEEKQCEEVVEILKKIKKEFKVNFANVSIPEVRTYIYKVSLPVEVVKNINEAILYTVEDNIPLKPEEVLVDYYILSQKENTIDVIVTAVPKLIIDLYTKVYNEAGLSPISFEPETHAIARGLIKENDKNKYLLLNLDSHLSSIAIIEEELVQYTQTLNTTSEDFLGDFDQEVAKKLKQEIQKVIIYWETSPSEIQKDKINTMFIVGGVKNLDQLINYLTKNLPVSVKLGNVWNNCFDLNNYIPKISASESINYATAIGLALKKPK